MKDVKPLIAEMIGTFYLCFPGIAAILSCTKAVAGPMDPGAALIAIALAHGLGLSIAVSVFGGISGAHVNPAVTIGMLVTGRIKAPMAAGYIVAQLLGATLAAAVCRAMFPAAAVTEANLGIPLPGEDVTVPIVLMVEFILTFLLITSVFGTAVDERGKAVKIGGFAIGLTVAFDILAGGRITGASMNPARSFGPALINGHFDWHWCYWVAPVAGGIAAALLYHHVLLKDEKGGK